MALAFLLLPSIGDNGVAVTLAIITAGYGLTGSKTTIKNLLAQ